MGSTLKKTFLDIPVAMHESASAHGAEQDPLTKEWFVAGEVPIPLLSFVFKDIRQAIPEYGPSCPRCGFHMVKRYRKMDGNGFWGCSRYPACQCTTEWDYGEAEHIAVVLKRSPLSLKDEPIDTEPSQPGKKDCSFLRPRWEALVAHAAEILGSIKAAERWLQTPMASLNGKKPIELIGTAEGCERIEKLLDSLFD